MPLRVLHVIGSMGTGGAESMIMNLYRNIDRKKVQFDFLVHSQSHAAHDDEIVSLGGRVYHIEKFNGFNALSYYEQCRAFFNEHEEFRVVHGHIGSSAALYLAAAKGAGAFTIAHSHSARRLSGLRDIAWKACSYPTRHIADFYFGCSEIAGVSRFGKRIVGSGKYSFFPNAIDLETFRYSEGARREVRRKLGIADSTALFGTVGRIAKEKNPGFMVDVFSELLQASPNVKCLWVGDGDLKEEVYAAIAGRGLSDRVIMAGVRRDVSSLMQAMDCFLLPSFYEGLPTVAIEAQATGLPCVISDRVTEEACVTPFAIRRNLAEGPRSWAAIAADLAGANPARWESYYDVGRSGFDIGTASKWIADFYLNCPSAEAGVDECERQVAGLVPSKEDMEFPSLL